VEAVKPKVTKAKKKEQTVKLGRGTLVGNAGEYYVMAELLRRNVIAALSPRNARAFDVLATKGRDTVRIRVKTKSAQFKVWQWMADKKSGVIFKDLQADSDFTVLVNLTRHTKDLQYFVIPTPTLNAWLQSAHKAWVKTPGKLGKPHDATSKHRAFDESKNVDRLTPYLDAWDSLWTPSDNCVVEFRFGRKIEDDKGKEDFLARTGDPEIIADCRKQLDVPLMDRLHISGKIERASAGDNLHWSWRHVESAWHLAREETEICDALPTEVEKHVDDWIGQCFCPWKSYVKAEVTAHVDTATAAL